MRRKGLSKRNHHFFHIALVAMGSNVWALVWTHLNVGDQQIRDDWLHRLQGGSGRGKTESNIWRWCDSLTCLTVDDEHMPLCLRQESHWEPECGTEESGRQVVWPPERMERKWKSCFNPQLYNELMGFYCCFLFFVYCYQWRHTPL